MPRMVRRIRFLVMASRPAKRHRGRRVVLYGAVAASVLGFASPVAAQVVAYSGQVQLVAPPRSVVEDRVESNDAMYVFVEQQQALLTAPLVLDARPVGLLTTISARKVTLPAGTRVQSHLVVADPVGRPEPTAAIRYGASVTFDQVVLGVALRDATLTATDFLGAPGTRYPSGSLVRGLERGDNLTISADRRTVFFNLIANRFDQVRIVTAAAVSH